MIVYSIQSSFQILESMLRKSTDDLTAIVKDIENESSQQSRTVCGCLSFDQGFERVHEGKRLNVVFLDHCYLRCAHLDFAEHYLICPASVDSEICP